MSCHHLDVTMVPTINLQPSTPTSPYPRSPVSSGVNETTVNIFLKPVLRSPSDVDCAPKSFNVNGLLSRRSTSLQKNLCRDKKSLKPLLMYLVRMGSFQSPHLRVPSVQSPAVEDCFGALSLKDVKNVNELLQYSLKQCQNNGPSSAFLARRFLKARSDPDENSLKVMQWNILSQALGYSCDKFDTCSQDDLQWVTRKWKIIYEICQYMPLDVICLQEVDHFHFIDRMLKKIGFEGKFVPKPDSPCYYIRGNSGPDGCAIFYNKNRLTLISSSFRTLEVYDCPSNQVVLFCKFKCKLTGKLFCVATTHLKARKGPILSCLRDEQGKDILDFLDQEAGDLPTIITGDFNADPAEPVYKTMSEVYDSAYRDALFDEPSFTNWTKREGEEEMKQTIDYIFYSGKNLTVDSVLELESQQLTGPIPNAIYPSDHLSLVASFSFV